MMKRRFGATAAMVAAALLAGVALVSADRLILRDGRRIEGQLVSVQRGIIEFREARGGRDSRLIEISRDEVERIDLEPARGFEERRPDRPFGRPRPSGLRESEVWVAGNRPWTDAGFDVREGQVLYFDTHGGDIEWRRGSRATAAGDPESTYSSRRPMPNRPIGALIARIGPGSNEYFFIGDEQGPVRMRASGRLFLGINDDNVSDNQGAFRVTVYY